MITIQEKGRTYEVRNPRLLRVKTEFFSVFVEVECPRCGKKNMIKVKGFKLCDVGCHCGVKFFARPMNLDGTEPKMWARLPNPLINQS